MLTTPSNQTSPNLIAPCGINCRLCRAYTREKNACPGCREEDANKARSCNACRIKNCEKLAAGKLEYCFDCAEFPCFLLKRLDTRYQSKYAASPIQNLLSIRAAGILELVMAENKKWACPECGAMLCMHKPNCLSCGYLWHK